MPQRRCPIEIQFGPEDQSRLPDALQGAAVVFLKLDQRGMLEQVADKLRVRRQGGYAALDLFLALVVFLISKANRGLRPFWQYCGKRLHQLASLAGRKSLASSSSISRALSSVEYELLRPVASWLLYEVADIDKVLKHPVVKTRDARGQGWHVFDVDPTVTTLRHRALPEGEDLPEPRRRSEKTAAPGYTGRKRGEMVFRRVTVQHAGSGMWIHAHLSPGNGEGVADLDKALDTVAETCERLDLPRSLVMVRMDGAFGNVPSYTACRERGLPFVTRLNRPKLYEDPELLARLRKADWRLVPDSRSGPQRSAADVGTMVIRPGKTTHRPDGKAYEAVTVRVVASIFPTTKDEAQRGQLIDGFQVELFAVDLPADAWPAAEAIAAYFGRSAEENRFAQEDREFGLDRILSYHLPGQELGTLVGLMLWNLQITEGFALDTPPATKTSPVLRQSPQRDARLPLGWPRDPVVIKILQGLGWKELLRNWPDWAWDLVHTVLLCPEHRPMNITSVRTKPRADGKMGVILRRAIGGCENCLHRYCCLSSHRKLASKHIEIYLDADIAERLRSRLAQVRVKPIPPSITPIEAKPGPYQVADALFLPARARQLFTSAMSSATIHIVVHREPMSLPQPYLVAVDVADRQRRRKTWDQNVDRYAMADGDKVQIKIECAPALRRLLGEMMPMPLSGVG